MIWWKLSCSDQSKCWTVLFDQFKLYLVNSFSFNFFSSFDLWTQWKIFGPITSNLIWSSRQTLAHLIGWISYLYYSRLCRAAQNLIFVDLYWILASLIILIKLISDHRMAYRPSSWLSSDTTLDTTDLIILNLCLTICVLIGSWSDEIGWLDWLRLLDMITIILSFFVIRILFDY